MDTFKYNKITNLDFFFKFFTDEIFSKGKSFDFNYDNWIVEVNLIRKNFLQL